MTKTNDVTFDEFLDALENNEGHYLVCPEGHGSVPPQEICPTCHSRGLSQASLPATGEVLTYTVVSVPTPQLSGDSPYITAIADFGPVNLTGLVRGIDPNAVAVGQEVVSSVETTATDNDRILVFTSK